ncbi:MAG: class I poly(R)-hydroxyalkanoic acid synthase [Alphaproteobacteria bacterium]|nr:class I poly(R)-hydroxyalkanoic acid synthase [Alphaproteobacteria bacterium]OJV13840.1 MAG: hypothetical protein BGO27_08075 [Alphaproteobacteria bacterium 33-17]
MAEKKSYEKLTENLFNIATNYPKLLNDYMNKVKDNYPNYANNNPFNLVTEFWNGIISNPEKFMKINEDWYSNHMKILNNVVNKFKGEELDDIYKAQDKDARFQDPAWDKNVYFDYLKQTYLMTSEWMNDIINDNMPQDPKNKKKVEFYVRQITDAFSPSNFVCTNPAVLREVIDSNADNLIEGLDKLYKDVVESKLPKISSVDMNAFKVGENIATTPGRIVKKTDISELICYYPKTKEVKAEPIVIVPPCINKYYILDLQPKNSFVNWLLEEGYQVYIVSWVNPDAKLKNTGFDDYVLDICENILKAQEFSHSKKVSVIGYCIGGTLLATSLAYLTANEQSNIISSAAFLTTLIDFTDPGDLGVFIDEEQIEAMEAKMERLGYHDASDMSMTFNLLRANDMIWSNVVNNYMLGKNPSAFDLLYWNADATRVPAAFHSFYLREMYLKNNLIKPNKIKIDNVPINILDINIPMYFMAAKEDHIVPWQSSYEITKTHKKNIRFILSESGHVGSVVNHPSRQKYGIYVNNKYSANTEKWLENAEYHKKSWWTDYSEWNNKYSKTMEKALTKKYIDSNSLYNAPGIYVMEK